MSSGHAHRKRPRPPRSDKLPPPPATLSGTITIDGEAAPRDVTGFALDARHSSKKTAAHFYAPPADSPAPLPPGFTHVKRHVERGALRWSLVDKQARTAARGGEARFALPPPPPVATSRARASVQTARFASVQDFFPDEAALAQFPRHVGWA